MINLHHGECLSIMRTMPDNSVDAIVTDPPYGLSFMGKKWDYDVPEQAVWEECLRVLKPGGHLLAFAGTRTQHRMAVRIEDAGFEIRDMIAWVYGSGFPKSMDVSKAIDKMGGVSTPPGFAEWLRSEREAAGLTAKELCERGKFYKNVNHGGLVSNWEAGLGFPDAVQFNRLCDLLGLPFERREETKREILGWRTVAPGVAFSSEGPSELPITAPDTKAARQWEGWGTALKPSHEPLTFARKPLDLRAHCIYLAQYLTSQLCQYSASVKDAGPSSMSSPSASGAAMSGSALWTAVGRCNTPGDLFALMDTLPSGSVLPSTLSTVFSWLRTLDGLLQHESTFTTETASSLTTDLKTLNSLLLRSTQGITIAELTEPSGHGSSAELVACIFNGFDASLRSTLARFAHGNAIAKAQEHYLDAGVSPALEPITVARKPFSGTVAANVLEHGTGALNIDGCRVEAPGKGWPKTRRYAPGQMAGGQGDLRGETVETVDQSELGRWPANMIHDGSEEVVGMFPVTGPSREASGVQRMGRSGGIMGAVGALRDGRSEGHSDSGGSAARFFYCAKASKADRDEGCEELPEVECGMMEDDAYPIKTGSGNLRETQRRNHHPTVKPTALMRYLCRLVTPPSGTVLDPFMGSGSTGKAAKLEGFNFIGIEREAEYVTIAQARIDGAKMDAKPKAEQTLFD